MLQIPDPASLPPCLLALTDDQRAIVDDQLSNNETATDEELITYWITEAALTADQAQAAIGFRDQALRDPFFQLFESTPGPSPGR